MKGSLAPLWLGLVVLLLGAYGGFKIWQTRAVPHSQELFVPAAETEADDEQLTQFTLTESSGEPFDSESLRGEVWVGSVFFTSCPTVCLELNRSIAKLQDDPQLAGVKFVSITCDPKNDTPERMQDYAARLGADPERWFFCTGEQSYIEKVAADILKIGVKGVTHSQRAMVIGRDGKVRGGFIITEPRSASELPNQLPMMKKALLQALAEPRPPQEVPAESKSQPADPQSENAQAAEDAPAIEAAPHRPAGGGDAPRGSDAAS